MCVLIDVKIYWICCQFDERYSYPTGRMQQCFNALLFFVGSILLEVELNAPKYIELIWITEIKLWNVNSTHEYLDCIAGTMLIWKYLRRESCLQ